MPHQFPRATLTPPRITPPAVTYLRGINSAGGEFGASATKYASFGGDPAAQYGTYWHFDSQTSFDYLAARGVKLIRLPIGWEHIQTSLGGPLNTTAFGYVTAALDRIGAAGMTAIVDLHNYGQYATADSGYLDQTLGQGVLTDAHLIDVWTKLAAGLKNHPAVTGYGLMNEPHDLYSTSLTFAQRAALWRTCTNNIVQAIRATGDTHVIAVMEMAIYSVSNWATWNPAAWISDPLNDREKIWYEQHIYQDANRGGKYPDSYATELAKAQAAGYASIFDRAMAWLQPWLDWLTTNNVRGFIGEYGVPADVDAASWAAEAEKLITVFDTHRLHFTWWGVGEWFHQYTLAPYVQATSNSGPLAITRPPVSTTFEAHPTV